VQESKNQSLSLIIGSFLVVLLGVGIAWLFSSNALNSSDSKNSAVPGAKVTSNSVGVLDPKVKYDNVSGMLKEGGKGNEGTHHLEREGGESQNVYLTSTVVDLSSFVGKKVEVWGQTLASKKAGWLMDVAKVQSVN